MNKIVVLVGTRKTLTTIRNHVCFFSSNIVIALNSCWHTTGLAGCKVFYTQRRQTNNSILHGILTANTKIQEQN